MKAGRATFAVVIAILIVVGAALFMFWFSLDSLVAQAIEKYGSQATGTSVRVQAVELSLSEGRGGISGLQVANPQGFSQPNAFSLGNIETRIDTSTVTSDPLVIERINITAPSIVYEINEQGVANIDVLRNNLARAGSGDDQAADEDAGEVGLIIRKLLIEQGQIAARIAALGGEPLAATLPPIELTDIGKQSNGATPAEVAERVVSELLNKIGPAVAELGVGQYLGKGLDEVKAGLGEKLRDKVDGDVTDKLGGALESVGGTDKLKGLLGN